jgi:hypothetical protein
MQQLVASAQTPETINDTTKLEKLENVTQSLHKR